MIPTRPDTKMSPKPYRRYEMAFLIVLGTAFALAITFTPLGDFLFGGGLTHLLFGS
jgi:hypothetical protein